MMWPNHPDAVRKVERILKSARTDNDYWKINEKGISEGSTLPEDKASLLKERSSVAQRRLKLMKRHMVLPLARDPKQAARRTEMRARFTKRQAAAR